WDVETGALRLPALLERARAPIMLLVESLDPRSHLGISGPRRVAPGISCAVIRFELVGDRPAALGRPLREGGDLADLLDRERHPGAHLVVEVGIDPRRLGVEV